jgi:hypothetical protein
MTLLFLKRLFIFLSFSLLITYCTKKMFRRVEVKGRLLHFFTKRPIDSDVYLVTDNNFSGRSKSVQLASTKTNSEGYFTLKGKASKAPDYYLNISDENQVRSVNTKEGGTTDLGEIYTGSQTFFCKVTLIPDSGKCLEYYGNTTLNFAQGTYTTFICSVTKTWQDRYSLVFPISYKTFNCGSQNQITNGYNNSIPITNADTLKYTIHY